MKRLTFKTYVFMTVLFYCCSSQETHQQQCEPLWISTCSIFNYTHTLIPNLLNHTDQTEAALKLNQFQPLLSLKCSPSLKIFLCLLFAPPCEATPKPPCRSLCESARNGCQPLMQKFGFQWPKNFNCSLFPHSNCETAVQLITEKANESNESAELMTSLKPEYKCERREMNLCQNYSTHVVFPNRLGHTTQEAASMEIHQFYPLIRVKCSVELKPFLCSLYMPSCNGPAQPPKPPCQSLCQLARNGCEPLMQKFGYQWPEILNCSLFSHSNCETAEQLITEGANESNESVELMTSPKPEYKCERREMNLCQNYSTHVVFPNRLGHSTQEAASMEIHQFYPLIQLQCSIELKPFLCSLYMPSCNGPAQPPKPPCRSLCQSARNGCESLLQTYGFQWPKNFNCSSFPDDNDCFR